MIKASETMCEIVDLCKDSATEFRGLPPSLYTVSYKTLERLHTRGICDLSKYPIYYDYFIPQDSYEFYCSGQTLSQLRSLSFAFDHVHDLRKTTSEPETNNIETEWDIL